MKKIFASLLVCLFLMPALLQAQDEGTDSGESSHQKVTDIFYGTRTVNLHTVEQVGKRVLAYRISHRFGSLSNRDFLYNFFGLDGPATISFMFDYGISDNLMIGVARDQYLKSYLGYVKYNLLNQHSGGGSPLTLSLYGKANLISERANTGPGQFNRYENFAHRMAYIAQVLVARRFGERFSFQIAPTYIHHNLVNLSGDKNDIFAATATAQFKLTKRLGLSGEFVYAIGDYAADPNTFQPSGSVGFDIVTGGHVFQIMLSNSPLINEIFGIPYTRRPTAPPGAPRDLGLRLGFNISRNFWL